MGEGLQDLVMEELELELLDLVPHHLGRDVTHELRANLIILRSIRKTVISRDSLDRMLEEIRDNIGITYEIQAYSLHKAVVKIL